MLLKLVVINIKKNSSNPKNSVKFILTTFKWWGKNMLIFFACNFRETNNFFLVFNFHYYIKYNKSEVKLTMIMISNYKKLKCYIHWWLIVIFVKKNKSKKYEHIFCIIIMAKNYWFTRKLSIIFIIIKCKKFLNFFII